MFLEPRLVLAYGMIATIGIVGLIVAIVFGKRRAQRRRRLRGIKTGDASRIARRSVH